MSDGPGKDRILRLEQVLRFSRQMTGPAERLGLSIVALNVGVQGTIVLLVPGPLRNLKMSQLCVKICFFRYLHMYVVILKKNFNGLAVPVYLIRGTL